MHSLLLVSDMLCAFLLNIMKYLEINRFMNKSKYHNVNISKKAVEIIKECGTTGRILKINIFFHIYILL